MTGLDKITSKIIAQAEADQIKTITKAEEECAQIAAEYTAKADEVFAKMRAEGADEVKKVMARASSAAAMDRRNIILSGKSRLIDDVFAEAQRRILELPDEQYLELLITLLSSAFLDQLETERVNREMYAESELSVVEKYEVILNQKDRERCGEALLRSVRRDMAGKLSVEVSDKLVLSDLTMGIEGGLILKYGDVEINCTIPMLISSIKDSIEAEVLKTLFD